MAIFSDVYHCSQRDILMESAILFSLTFSLLHVHSHLETSLETLIKQNYEPFFNYYFHLKHIEYHIIVRRGTKGQN